MPAVYRGCDPRITQLNFGVVYGCLVGRYRGFRRFNRGLVGVHHFMLHVGVGGVLFRFLLRNRLALEELLVSDGLGARIIFLRDVAAQIGLRLAQGRVIVGHVRFGLFDLRFQRAGIDGKQKIALLHVVAFVNRDVIEDAADLAFHRNGFVGFDVSDYLHVDGGCPLPLPWQW